MEIGEIVTTATTDAAAAASQNSSSNNNNNNSDTGIIMNKALPLLLPSRREYSRKRALAAHTILRTNGRLMAHDLLEEKKDVFDHYFNNNGQATAKVMNNNKAVFQVM